MSIKAKDGNLDALHDLATQVRPALGDGSGRGWQYHGGCICRYGAIIVVYRIGHFYEYSCRLPTVATARSAAAALVEARLFSFVHRKHHSFYSGPPPLFLSPPETVSPSQVRACLGLLEEAEEEEEDEPPALSFRIINNYTVTSISEVNTHGHQSFRSFCLSRNRPTAPPRKS